MGFRFQRRIRILPGLRLNLSKSGISTSIGVRGAHVTVGRGQARTTVGLPGTGLSYTEVRNAGHEPHVQPARQVEAPTPPGSAVRGWVWIGLAAAALTAAVATAAR